MANDSSTGGYLAPESTAPAEDLDLDALIQPVIVGITGLADAMVLIKGQVVPANQPPRTSTWCAFAVTSTRSDANPDEIHDGTDDSGLGTSTLVRGEYMEVTATFYGPAARATAALLRDGLGLRQNRDALRANGLAYVGMERIAFVPDLENTQFVRRADVVFRLNRMVNRTYPIRNILSVQGTITVDSGDSAGQTNVISDFEASTS